MWSAWCMHMELFISEYNAHDLQSDFCKYAWQTDGTVLCGNGSDEDRCRGIACTYLLWLGIQAVEHAMENTDSEKTLLLEHNGSEGNLIFIVDKPEFLIGKSKEADGTIANSTKVSRNHCRIVREMAVIWFRIWRVQMERASTAIRWNQIRILPEDGDSLVLADVEFKITVS